MRHARYLLLALLVALPVISWAASAHAQMFHSGTNVSLPAGRVVNNTVFVAGRTVNIAGVINGDVFCAGQDVTVSAQVHGDVLCTGQNVTVTGMVTGDIRLLGQDVKVGATVSGNASIAAQTFAEQSDGSIRGDVMLAGQDGSFHGSVGRDIAASVNSLSIASSVGRNVHAVLQHLHLDDSARVGGNITYTSNNKLQRDGGAQVHGHITKHTPVKRESSKRSLWSLALYAYLASVIASLVLVLLVPHLFEKAARVARAGLGWTFLTGFIASIVVPVVVVALLISLIGIPLAILLAVAWLLALLLAGPVAAYLFSRSLVRGEANAVLVMLIGAVILFFAFLLPFAGWIIWLISMWFGLGAIVRSVMSMGRPRYRTGPLTAPPEETASQAA